jgi:peptidoglycan/xylan/chitin deacetylase (PgdA/CDA1 family)
VALTFDDGPSGRFTSRLLKGLQARDVQVTFLLCGYRLRDYPGMAEQILANGHEIGLHGDTHGDLSRMTDSEITAELLANLRALPAGCKPAFLRPPGGATGPAVARAAKAQGLALLNWSVDPRDWCNHDAATVEAAVVSTVRDGDVILLHDLCDCSVDAALAIIDRLQGQGFRFVTVSQLAQLKGVTLKPGVLYEHFR